MPKRYWTITDRSYDLSGLSSEEQAFLGEIFELYSRRPRMTQFINACMRRGLATIWKTGEYETSPAYHICQDLQARLGIAEKKLFPPDYRDYIAALIEERFPSRYRFCKEVGITESHLSRVLAGKKELARETYKKILDALGLEEGPPVPRRQLSDYLELDNPEVELAALGRWVKWLERRREELVGSDPNLTLSTGEGSPSPSRPCYLPRDIAALDSFEAVAEAIEQALTEMQQLAERISEQAKARIRKVQESVPPSPLRGPASGPRLAAATEVSGARVEEVAPALSSAFQRTESSATEADRFKWLTVEAEDWVIEQIGLFWQVSKPWEVRNIDRVSVLVYQNDRVAIQPFFSDLVKRLDCKCQCPGIISATPSDPSVTILDISGIKGAEERVGRLAEERGVQFFPTLAEFHRFQRGRKHEARGSTLRQWIENRLVIRYVMEPGQLDPFPFLKMVRWLESRRVGLALSLMHASVLEHSFIDCLVLDSNREPVTDARQLSPLLQPEFYRQFGVARAHLLKKWSEFYRHGLSKEVRTLAMRRLWTERRRETTGERVENLVQQILSNYPQIIAGMRGGVEEPEGLADRGAEGRREVVENPSTAQELSEPAGEETAAQRQEGHLWLVA